MERSQGVTLVVVLIFLAIMGLTAATGLRTVTGSERIASDLQLDRWAERSAEQALRFCESEIDKPKGNRINELDDVDGLPAVSVSDLQWAYSNAWGANRSATAQSQSRFYTLNVATQAGQQSPQCLVVRLQLNLGADTVLITARGFSPGYLADPATGRTLSGSVVWLQSTLYYN
jgi:type IV pilus assembly protein PilX